ncbi:hypothetical protein RQP46_010500 [Phenoliferia psychrophenolica]
MDDTLKLKQGEDLTSYVAPSTLTVDAPVPREEKLTRGLAGRHQQMIAIGGIIGSGYFLGTGTEDQSACFSFALGWDYWYGLAVTIPAEVTAGALVISFWDTSTNVSVWIVMFVVLIGATNLVSIRVYGEAEFWMAIMKVIAFLGIVIDLGGAPNHDRLGFRYWKDPGPFAQLADIPGQLGQFLAFWSTFVNAAFSYGGVEVIALTAAEASNPEITIPRCIKSVFWRIIFFYIGGVFVIGLTVPYTNELLLSDSGTATASPFVIAIQAAGIHGLPSVINAVILLSTVSASSSYLYAASRTLFGLAQDGQAPAFLKRTTKNGLPYTAIGLTISFGALAFMNVSSTGGTVFQYLYTISAITCILAWITILFTYLRFRAGCFHQGIDRSTLPYQAPYQPYLTYFGIVFIFLITMCNGFELFLSANGPFDYSTFFTSYIAIPVYILLYCFWKFYKKTTFVTLDAMDLTGLRTKWKPADDEAARAEADEESLRRTFGDRVKKVARNVWQ